MVQCSFTIYVDVGSSPVAVMSNSLMVKTHYGTLRAIYNTKMKLHEELSDMIEKKKIKLQNLLILIMEVHE